MKPMSVEMGLEMYICAIFARCFILKKRYGE